MISRQAQEEEPYSQRVILAALGFFVLAFGFFISPVQAQTPTPEPSPTPQKTLEDKIQGIRDAVKEKVQERIEVAKKRAWVGQIKEISNSTLTLETREGEKQTQANDETIIIDQEKKEVKFADLAIDNYIIAMGYVEASGLLEAHRIVVTEKPATPDQLVAFGEVTDKSKEENILTVKHPKKEIVWSVEIVGKTTTAKGKRADFEEIEIGDQLVAIGSPDGEKNFLTAKIIKIIASAEKPSPTPETEK